MERIFTVEETCVLDIAKHPRTLEDIGDILGITRERVRQIEEKTLKNLRIPRRLKIIEDFEDMVPFEETKMWPQP